jgi:polysaccharide export outer membrane protein
MSFATNSLALTMKERVGARSHPVRREVRRPSMGPARAGLLLLAMLLTAPAASALAQSSARSDRAGAPEPSLRPGDAIRLRIWREPDLTGEFRVDQSGVAVLPKLGEVRVEGIPADALREQLVKEYERFLTHTSIEVVFLRRIQVTGAVRTPGLYLVDPTMTVGDALAQAGGITSAGSAQHVQLTRGGQRVSSNHAASDPLIELALRSGDQLYVPERTWMSRNPNLVISLVLATVSLTVTLIRYH